MYIEIDLYEFSKVVVMSLIMLFCLVYYYLPCNYCEM